MKPCLHLAYWGTVGTVAVAAASAVYYWYRSSPGAPIVSESLTIRAKRIARRREQNGQVVFDGGLGENPAPLPTFMLHMVQGQLFRTKYTTAEGCLNLKDVLGCPRVLVGNGLKPLLFTVLRAFLQVYPNLQVVHMLPAWLTYREQTRLLGVRTLDVMAEGCARAGGSWKVSAKALDDALATLPLSTPILIFFNNPNNPSGIVYDDTDIRALAGVCRKYKAMVFSDCIYKDLSHTKTRVAQIQDYYPARTMWGFSLSKSFGTGGYRCGFVCFPPELHAEYRASLAVGSALYTCPSPPLQHATVGLLGPVLKDKVTTFFNFQRRMFRESIHLARQRLNAMGIGTGDSGGGAWYLLLDFEPNFRWVAESSPALADRLLTEVGFLTVPGSAFGIPPSRLVLRYSCVAMDNIQLADETFSTTPVSTCMDALEAWLSLLPKTPLRGRLVKSC